METLFRKHFWVFHIAFLAIVAFLLASAVNTIVASKLKGLAGADAAAPVKTTAREDVRTRNFNIMNEANIFGALREDLSVPEAECESNADCENGVCEEGQCIAKGEDVGPIPELADAVRSKLRARLVGTAVFSDASFSVASIVDESAGKNALAELFSINACVALPAVPVIPDDEEGDDDDEENATPINRALQAPCNELLGVATVKYIDPDRVYFYNRDEKQWEYLQLGEEPEGPITARKKKKKKKTGVADLGDGIRKKGDGQYEVDQAEVDKALGNLASLATQARIVPAFESGKPVGFKLFSIRPNSLYSKIGVQNGDVIKRINGYEINSPDKALEIYQKLKDSKNVTVDLKRRGKPLTLEYGIVP